MFGRLKDNRQKFFEYFRMGVSKFENFKVLLPIDSRKNEQWRRSIATEERLA
jgi:hypothetical protein